jgi:hypothetical protein
MLIKAKHLLSILLVSIMLGSKSTTIKVFHVFESFGTETQELKNSIVMNFDSRGYMLDSTVYSHTLPLSEKYVYVSGPEEGLKLRRSYNREMVLSYKFEYNNIGNKISTTLYGTGDSLYWRQYQKYDGDNNIIKRIRYNPIKAINPDMMHGDDNSKGMLWGESYDYDSTGTILERKDLYNNYVLVITSFELNPLEAPKKQGEYFDPSVIFQTIFFHNDSGQLTQKHTVGRLGQSLGSKTYKYDILGRRVATTVYNEEGTIQKIYNTVFDDDNFKTYDYYSDSDVKLSSIKEVLLDNQGRKYVEAILDGQDRVLEKNVYFYDDKGRVEEIKQYDMLRRGREGINEIPIRVNTYEYD